ncbi:DUF2240 family protein [Halococcoides cellulosivorans]|uniref:DUF2240 domain-containing protein n=1 Tax=Halococcoides cellulosivorans TaxID=1679096 RepID=A0A2R4X1D4_9EURY|nr:DUF2240 family protein [Halococcoides cellulosivorans]AWB27585.1 DUF2240 domain-containing protein [Halococcoides cellulosivorans]
MSLEGTVAAPYRDRGTTAMSKSEFVVALSLDRDWFSPDQAERVIDVARSEGLLDQDDDTLTIDIDPATVDLPEGFVPDESILQQRSTFERVLERVTSAGVEKRTAVAEINRLQGDLAVPIEAAAVVYARQEGVALGELPATVLADLGETGE